MCERPCPRKRHRHVCSEPGGAVRPEFTLFAPESPPRLLTPECSCSFSVHVPVALLSNWLSLLSVHPSPATALSHPLCILPDWGWTLQSVLSLVGKGGQHGQAWGRLGSTREGIPVKPWFAQGCLRSSSTQEGRGGPSWGQSRAHFLGPDVLGQVWPVWGHDSPWNQYV